MNLSTKIFEIAKQRDEEYLAHIREHFLHVFECDLERLLEKFESWEYKKEEFTFSHFGITKLENLQRGTRNLGFILEPCSKEQHFYISILKRVEGQEENYAQKMISQFEEKLKERINFEKASAKTEYEKIVELLKNEDFNSHFYDENGNSESFIISVKKSSKNSSISQPFLEELKKLLENKGFYDLSSNPCMDSWDFVVRK